MLDRLGMSGLLDAKTDELSGGQQKRVALAQLLVNEWDALILDEPTNHLDVKSINALINFIKNPSNKYTYVIVSHDVFFMNSVINKIWELENQTITTYGGNYDFYVEQKELQFLRNNLKKSFIEYGSHLEAPTLIDNYLKILAGSINLIVGTRSSIFLPLKEDAEILIVDDLSFAFYESRFPYWNVRDLALIRSKNPSSSDKSLYASTPNNVPNGSCSFCCSWLIIDGYNQYLINGNLYFRSTLFLFYENDHKTI